MFRIINPLEFSDWDAQLGNHPDASFFFGSAWARVLRDSYRHTPLYFCRFDRDRLRQLLPVMEVSSWLTGRRGVSLPFADYCLPLTTDGEDLSALYAFAIEQGRKRSWRYFESRGCFAGWLGAVPSIKFFGHRLHLQGNEDAMLKMFSGAVRRGIRKATREGVRVDFGNTDEDLKIFCQLHGMTRHRHGLPLQPDFFFQNISQHILQQHHGFVAVARHQQRPIAASIFFHTRDTTIFKFGASDYAFQRLRPNNLVMWEVIKKCLLEGKKVLDFGRTSLANDGLRRYKLGWGTDERVINYFKFDIAKAGFVFDHDKAFGFHTNVFRGLPQVFGKVVGSALYKHFT